MTLFSRILLFHLETSSKFLCLFMCTISFYVLLVLFNNVLNYIIRRYFSYLSNCSLLLLIPGTRCSVHSLIHYYSLIALFIVLLFSFVVHVLLCMYVVSLIFVTFQFCLFCFLCPNSSLFKN